MTSTLNAQKASDLMSARLFNSEGTIIPSNPKLAIQIEREKGYEGVSNR